MLLLVLVHRSILDWSSLFCCINFCVIFDIKILFLHNFWAFPSCSKLCTRLPELFVYKWSSSKMLFSTIYLVCWSACAWIAQVLRICAICGSSLVAFFTNLYCMCVRVGKFVLYMYLAIFIVSQLKVTTTLKHLFSHQKVIQTMPRQCIMTFAAPNIAYIYGKL